MGAGPALVTLKSKQINSVLDFIPPPPPVVRCYKANLLYLLLSYTDNIHIFMCVYLCIVCIWAGGKLYTCNP